MRRTQEFQNWKTKRLLSYWRCRKKLAEVRRDAIVRKKGNGGYEGGTVLCTYVLGCDISSTVRWKIWIVWRLISRIWFTSILRTLAWVAEPVNLIRMCKDYCSGEVRYINRPVRSIWDRILKTYRRFWKLSCSFNFRKLYQLKGSPVRVQFWRKRFGANTQCDNLASAL